MTSPNISDSRYVGTGRGLRDTRRNWKRDNWLYVAVHNAFDRARSRALRQGVEHSMPKGSISAMIDDCDGRCAVTGILFRNEGVGPYSPSLDRVKPELGYTPGNVRLVLNAINSAKMNGTDEDLLFICRAVVERNSL